MVNRCCVGNCSNTNSPEISLFRFPADQVVRSKWIEQIKRTRVKWSGPGQYSLVCSKHFTEDCFDPVTKIRSDLGWKQRKTRKLLSSAVPTLFERKSEAAFAKRKDAPSPPASKKPRTAFQKREKQRVSWYIGYMFNHNVKSMPITNDSSVAMRYRLKLLSDNFF